MSAEDQRWFQRAVGHRAPGRRAVRNADRANGLLKPRRPKTGLMPVINPNRDIRSAKSGRLREELR